MFNSRLGCSSISFRHQDLPTALRTIAAWASRKSTSAPCPACAITSPTTSTPLPSPP